MRLTLGVLLTLGSVSLAWPATISGQEIPAPGTYKQLMDTRVGGFRRSFLVHVPVGYDGTTALPLVVAIHGAFSSGKKLARESGFSRLADREGFVVVYPNGIGLFGLLRHWNSGHCCGKALKDDIDDVAFVIEVVDEVSRLLRVDPARIYVVGHSNGGMLTHRIAAERAERVAAIAPVSATIGGTPSADAEEWVIPDGDLPVPVMMIHGRADENVPYEGGRGTQSKGESGTISAARSAAYWVERNGCEPEPTVDRTYGDRVTRETWSGPGGADVVLYSIDDWAHDWPGPYFIERRDAVDELGGFDAAEIIWEFLREHRREAD